MTLTEIIELVRKYARARAKLSGRCLLIQRAINRIKAENLPELRAASIAVRTAEDDLYREIDNSRDLFEKPKTLEVDDISFGLRKGKGTISWDDDDKLMERIRKNCSKDQIALLIRTKETPDKSALAKLPMADLRKLGVTLMTAGDNVFINAVESDAEKLALAFLKDDNDDKRETAQ